MSDIDPGSFSFGPLWWTVALAIAALVVVGTMLLFLWQASKEQKPHSAGHHRLHRAAAPDRSPDRSLDSAPGDPGLPPTERPRDG